jgi:hypothetical protein
LSPVSYPFGRLPDGGAIHIEDYADEAVMCFDCRSPLIAKRGDYLEWHFAHHPDATSSCSGESALHEMSKIVIAQQHARARKDARPYRISWLCDRCKTEQSFDCAKHWSHAESEARVVDGVRSDLYFHGEKPFAIEVVVTNELSPEGRMRYFEANVPVFVFRPQWRDARELRDVVLIAEALGLPLDRCRGCQTKATRERELESLFNRLRDALCDEPLLDRAEAYRRLGNWPPDRDPSGHPLFGGAKHRIRDQALRLIQSGFSQHASKRWVFSRSLPENVGAVYVGLAGDGIDPAWSRRAPEMELRLSVPLTRVEVFGDLIHWHLERRGIFVNESWRRKAKLAVEEERKAFGQKQRRRRR